MGWVWALIDLDGDGKSSGIETAIDATIAIGLFVTALVVIGKATVSSNRWMKKINDFLDDWNGIPATPLEEAKPGMPARMHSLERSHAADHDMLVRAVHKALRVAEEIKEAMETDRTERLKWQERFRSERLVLLHTFRRMIALEPDAQTVMLDHLIDSATNDQLLDDTPDAPQGTPAQ